MADLEGPDGFHRNTIVVQETRDNWPIVYMWDGSTSRSRGRLVRWVFKSGGPEQQNAAWDTDKPPEDCRALTYEEWWAFIYYVVTHEDKHPLTSDFERQFYDEVLQPQTSEEKNNV